MLHFLQITQYHITSYYKIYKYTYYTIVVIVLVVAAGDSMCSRSGARTMRPYRHTSTSKLVLFGANLDSFIHTIHSLREKERERERESCCCCCFSFQFALLPHFAVLFYFASLSSLSLGFECAYPPPSSSPSSCFSIPPH